MESLTPTDRGSVERVIGVLAQEEASASTALGALWHDLGLTLRDLRDGLPDGTTEAAELAYLSSPQAVAELAAVRAGV